MMMVTWMGNEMIEKLVPLRQDFWNAPVNLCCTSDFISDSVFKLAMIDIKGPIDLSNNQVWSYTCNSVIARKD